MTYPVVVTLVFAPLVIAVLIIALGGARSGRHRDAH